jgi:hypothetical protein
MHVQMQGVLRKHLCAALSSKNVQELVFKPLKVKDVFQFCGTEGCVSVVSAMAGGHDGDHRRLQPWINIGYYRRGARAHRAGTGVPN